MLDNCFGRPGSMPNPAGGPLLAWTTAGIAFLDVDLVHGPFAPDPGWFRGYQYARYLRRITAVSLLTPTIAPAVVHQMSRAIADAWNHYPRWTDPEQVITQPNDRFIRLETRLPDNAMPSQQVLDGLSILSRQIAHDLLLATPSPRGQAVVSPSVSRACPSRCSSFPVILRCTNSASWPSSSRLPRALVCISMPGNEHHMTIPSALFIKRKTTPMSEFRMTFVVIQQQMGMFANARDAAEELQAFSWEGATIQTLLEHRDPYTHHWCPVALSPPSTDHDALLAKIVMMQDGDAQRQQHGIERG